MPWPRKKVETVETVETVESVESVPSFPTGKEDQHLIEYDNYGRVVRIDNVLVPIRQEHAINAMPPEIVISPTENLNKATSGAPAKRKYKTRKKKLTRPDVAKQQRRKWRWGMPETSQKVEKYVGFRDIEVYAFDMKSAARMIAGKTAESLFGRVSYYRQCRVTPRQPADKTMAQFRVLIGAGLGSKIKGVQREYEIAMIFRVRHVSEYETTPKIPEYLKR